MKLAINGCLVQTGLSKHDLDMLEVCNCHAEAIDWVDSLTRVPTLRYI